MTLADELNEMAFKIGRVFPNERLRLHYIAIEVDRMTKALDTIVQESLDTSRAVHEARNGK